MAYQSRGIEIQHFDTKTGKIIDVAETFNNTVAEYLFPDTKFELGTVYEGNKTTEKELQRFSDKSLQFANGNKFYFADRSDVREQLFPTASDGAAYGSLPFTPCQEFTEVENISVLVIDDETGENNANLDPEYAKTLVGDCYCRIDNNLHQQVKGRENIPFQFRLGIKAQENSPVARIAKGTVSPMDLRQVGDGYDLILATSAFKGRKTEQAEKIKPGAYNLIVGLGVKSSAYYGTHSLGPQVLVNYPKGVKQDIVPLVIKELEKLEAISSDPLVIAKDFMESTEQRYKYRVLDELGIDEEDLTGRDLDDVMSMIEEEKNNDIIYKLLKNDIDKHRQLLEHPKIVDALNNHLQSRYREIATGRFIKFKGGLLQPHHELKASEFCDPKLPNGAKVIVTRSPLVNSNGVITLTNRHLEDIKHLEGTVYMNAKTAADYLQGDFDGDRVAYELASKYPNLAAEVEEKHLPDNRYKDIEKRSKTAYKGSFEQIALSAKDNKIGIIAIKVMKAVGLEMELDNLPQEKVEEYINDLSDHFCSLWRKDKKTGKEVLPKFLVGREKLVKKLADLGTSNQSKSEKIKIIKSFLHFRVNELAAQLQIAVDGPKSAQRPDDIVLSANELLMGYRDMNWLKEYKDSEIYKNQVLASNNYSPVDLMIQPVNEVWEDNSLQARQNHQFEQLFKDVEVSEQDIKEAEEVKKQYNKLNSYGFRLKEEYSSAPGPRLTLKTKQGEEIEIIHTLSANHSDVYNIKSANVYFRKNESNYSHPELKYVAFAEVVGEKNDYGKPLYKRIGYVSKISEREQQKLIKPELNKSKSKIINVNVSVNPGVTPNQVKAAFGQVREYIQTIYHQTTSQDKLSKAAALWQVTHRRLQKIRNRLGKLDDSQRFNKANVAFAIFGDEIAEQLETLQFNQVKIAGVNSAYSQTGVPPQLANIPIITKVENNELSPQFSKRVICLREQAENGKINHKRIGYLPEDEPQLPIFSMGTATVNKELKRIAIATNENGQEIEIGELKNHYYADTSYENTELELEISSAIPKGRKNPVPAVKLNGKILGLIKNKESQKILEQQNLTEGKIIKVNLNRDYENTVVTINVDSLNYAPKYSTEKRLLEGKKHKKDKVNAFWTMENNQARIVCHHTTIKDFQTYFNKKKVEYKISNDYGSAGRESDLGLVVFELKEKELNKLNMEQIEKVWGKPLSPPEYSAILDEIAKSTRIKEEKNQQQNQKNNNLDTNNAPENNKVVDSDNSFDTGEDITQEVINKNNNVKLNLGGNKQSNFISLNEIPSDPEVELKYLMEQQQRTEKVAPIAIEILKLKNKDNSPTQSYIGQTYDLNYDGHYLTITDKQCAVKMKAKFMGIDPTTQKQKWLSNLPENSPGLTEDDVKQWTSEAVKEAIKLEKIKQCQNNLLST